MTTATFRDYNFEALCSGEFSIDTSGEKLALLTLALNHREFKCFFAFDREVARTLGSDLIRYQAPCTDALEPIPYATDGGDPLLVDVCDGIVTLIWTDSVGGRKRKNQMELSDEETLDLAQRLIVWAGVNV